MYKCELESGQDKTILTISGELTVQNAVSVKQYFLSLLDTKLDMEIKHFRIEEFDLSYLQLLNALIISADVNGRKLKLSFDDVIPFKEFLANAGFNDPHEKIGKAIADSHVGGMNV